MYSRFDSFASLSNGIVVDKEAHYPGTSGLNRYPVRFILFNSVEDYSKFIDVCAARGAYVQRISDWLLGGGNDKLLTYTELAEHIKEKAAFGEDFVITPFSEIARFFGNSKREFRSLMKTLGAWEASPEGQRAHQRVYIPLMGISGMLEKLITEPGTNVWDCCSPAVTSDKYRIILTNGTTYGFNFSKDSCVICHNTREWVKSWEDLQDGRRTFICSSKTLFNAAQNISPNDCFEYVRCETAYNFMQDGLGLDLGGMEFRKNEVQYWEILAKEIRICSVDLTDYINRKFSSYRLQEDEAVIAAWHSAKDKYSRWLLKNYCISIRESNSYLVKVLTHCREDCPLDLFCLLLTCIYENPCEEDIAPRLRLLRAADKLGFKVPDSTEKKIKNYLQDCIQDSTRGITHAMHYITSYTPPERNLLVQWLGHSLISREQIKELLPCVYSYTAEDASVFSESCAQSWLVEYFREYVRSRVSNSPSDKLEIILKEHNGSSAQFESWSSSFKTVDTILHMQQNIEHYIWIDGLGVEWIPLIRELIESHSDEGIYLNDLYIATSKLPSTTEVNKPLIVGTAKDRLTKYDDLDTIAHRSRPYPECLIDDILTVKKIVEDIIAKYKDKKIALISDHGMTYMAQHYPGCNLAGFEAEHEGRCAKTKRGLVRRDEIYHILEDNETVCALRHCALTAKTPLGQGAHGGATPEEVLVPVFIISPRRLENACSVKLITNAPYARLSRLEFEIRGLKKSDYPCVVYNSKKYLLSRDKGVSFMTENIPICTQCKGIRVMIGVQSWDFSLEIRGGAVENDDFFGEL